MNLTGSLVGGPLDRALYTPDEVVYNIFSYLTPEELCRCLRVNKEWQRIASDERLWKPFLSPIAFGKIKWEKYFGDVGEEPSLNPKDVCQILKSPCPFWTGKRVEETHILTLVPETVDGNPLDLNVLSEIVKSPKNGGHVTGISSLWERVTGQNLEKKSHWVLMTKELIQTKIVGNSYEESMRIRGLAGQILSEYTIPYALEAAVSLLMHYVDTKERLLSFEKNTLTKCQDFGLGINRYIHVGDFSEEELSVSPIVSEEAKKGIAALRTISETFQ